MNLDWSSVRIHWKYPEGKYPDDRPYPAVDELRPIELLNADLPTLFPYTGNGELIPGPERHRPQLETRAAIVLRSVYSPSPWEEDWVAFWRDHFSINGNDGSVRAFVPHWERTVLREHCWGNFRQMIEASSKHPAMLSYLNNRSSRAGSANENYARELFELHTLGKGAYLNNLFAQWKKVPGAKEGKPAGYIDEDVYEAARSFTGWAMADGTGLGGGQALAKTGEFCYVESWHDNYQKRVLANEFQSFAGSMSDGNRVLDLCADHPATAQHLAKKLVTRFVSDQPPPDLVKSTARVFEQESKSAHQLRKVFEHLVVHSQKMPIDQRQKARTPTQLVGRFARAVNLPLNFQEAHILWMIDQSGPPLYAWPTPEGPRTEVNWLVSSSYLRNRIDLMQGLAQNWWGTGVWDPFDGLPAKPSYQEMMARWESPLFGMPRPDLSMAILSSQKMKAADFVNDVGTARRLIGLLACAPSFQLGVALPTPEQIGLPAQSVKKKRASS